MSHRIFVAFNISDNLKTKIDEWKESFKKKSLATYNHIRWVKNENLHITLIPPFYCSEIELEQISRCVKEVVSNCASFDVHFNNISYGPNLFAPRLIWITGNTRKELAILKDVLVDNMLRLNLKEGFAFEIRRDFLLHLTIARFNQHNFKYFNIKKIDENFEFKEKLNEVILFESFLKKEGAQYVVIKRFSLKKEIA